MQTQNQPVSFLFVSILLVVGVGVFLILIAAIGGDFAESSEISLKLNHTDFNISLEDIEELGKLSSEESVKALMGVVEDRHEDWRLQIKAIKLLSGVDDQRVANLLIRVLTDPFLTFDCPALKWNAAVELGNFGKYQDVVDALIKGLADDVVYVREAAIQSLGQIGSMRAVPYLLSALNDKSFAIRISAVKALGKIGDNKAVPYLKEVAANDTDQYIKDEAEKALRTLSAKMP
jgi:HEAT repeat protein